MYIVYLHCWRDAVWELACARCAMGVSGGHMGGRRALRAFRTGTFGHHRASESHNYLLEITSHASPR